MLGTSECEATCAVHLYLIRDAGWRHIKDTKFRKWEVMLKLRWQLTYNIYSILVSCTTPHNQGEEGLVLDVRVMKYA